MYYTAKQVQKILGITSIQYSNLINRKHLVCSFPAGDGPKGVSHKYSKEDMIRNMILIELMFCGINRTESSEIAHELGKNMDRDIKVKLNPIIHLVINGRRLCERLKNYDEQN